MNNKVYTEINIQHHSYKLSSHYHNSSANRWDINQTKNTSRRQCGCMECKNDAKWIKCQMYNDGSRRNNSTRRSKVMTRCDDFKANMNSFISHV